MALETATYIAGMTPSWPLAGDLKSQGDDHIRLIKATLQATFPSGDRPFYFPKTEAVSGTISLDATDQNNMVTVDTTAGNVTVNLPGSLGTSDKGWACEVVKTSNDANAAIVTPASGTIASKSGSTATIRVGLLCEPARFIWTGTGWLCSKPGPMIGTTESFDGPTTPPGYLDADGSAFSNTAFAELFAVLGSSTLRDKGGRVEAGKEGTATRLTTAGGGIDGATLGAASSLQKVTLAADQIPSLTSSGANTITVSSAGNNERYLNFAIGAFNDGGNTAMRYNNGTSFGALSSSGSNNISVSYTNGAQADVKLVQPTIIVKKIVRAC